VFVAVVLVIAVPTVAAIVEVERVMLGAFMKRTAIKPEPPSPPLL
jgi:hypothetical protein